MTKLLEHLTPDSGLAYVLVQHLAPTHAPIGYLTLDAAGKIVDINQEAAVMLNTPQARLFGKPFLPYVHRPDIKKFSWHLARCASGGGTTELRLAGDKPRHVRLSSRRAFAPDWLNALYYTVVVDTTEERRQTAALRENEKRHRQIVETANEGICIIDPSNEIAFANQRLGAMVGIPAESLIGRSARELLSDDDVDEGRDVQTEGARISPPERRLRRADGTRLYVSTSETEMRDEQGAVTGRLRMYADATARYELMATREEFVRQMVAAQESERQRIARELHDQLGQHIIGLSLGLARLATLTSEPEAGGLIARLREAADLLAKDVHTLAMELRPSALDHLGLAAAIRAYTEEVAERSGLDIDFHADAIDDSELEPAVQTGIYRIAQEALTNIVKHARARHVSVLVERHADALQLIVEDDGDGFDPQTLVRGSNGRLGLGGMRERAAIIGGSLTIESALRQGTTVYARIPLKARANEHDQKTSTPAG